MGELLFWMGLLISVGIGAVYFRDLGDVSQMLLRVKRENMVRFIRNEYQLLAAGLGAAVVMTVAHFVMGTGPDWLFWLAIGLMLVLYGFPWVWVHVGLRNQLNTAKYYTIQEARKHINPASSVMVIEKDGVARAHPDAEIMRPHLAGNAEGLDGEDVVMTYCAMANLGLAYTPNIDGERLDIEVLAQHGNNLILRDNNTGEPIQHIYGTRERDGKSGTGMQPWPTFRMSFRGFQKAYPEGTVYLNKPSGNPILRLFDTVMQMVFASSIAKHHQEEKPVMDNMTHYDDRLPNKTYIWGVNIADEAVCWTDDFVAEHDDLINARVGGRDIVIYGDRKHESLGVWYNDSGQPVQEMDFFGNSDQGKLQRVETLKPGMFWHVWVEFFPETEINRVTEPETAAA